jgi:hypothetical protein
MAISYTWKVTGLKTRDADSFEKAVVQTYWKKIGTDENGNVGEFSGATPFSTENIAASAFVPFTSLTEATVIGWIQSVVVGNYEEHVNGVIKKQIDLIAAPIVEATVPWGSGGS